MYPYHVNFAGESWPLLQQDVLVVTAMPPFEGDVLGPSFPTQEAAEEARYVMVRMNADHREGVRLAALLQALQAPEAPRHTVVQTSHCSSLLVFDGGSEQTLDDVNGPSFADATTAEAWAATWDDACDVQDYNLLLTLARLAQDGKAA